MLTQAPSRRRFLAQAGGGLGLLGLADLLHQNGKLRAEPPSNALPTSLLAPKAGHFPAKAKSVIWLYMYGAPSGMDTFEYKPELQKRDGQVLPKPPDVLFGHPGPLMKSPFKFSQYGQNGTWVSELFPNVAKHVDELAFLRGCTADSNNHAPACMQMNTGVTRIGHPSAGAWVTYGLGSENQNLPGFMVMYDHRSVPVAGTPNWGNGFLPATYQGVTLRPTDTPLLYSQWDAKMTAERQRAQLDFLQSLNKDHRQHHDADTQSELDARIASYELAYRMQMTAPDVVNLQKESQATKTLYGLDKETTKPFGTQLLIARRLVEQGVRFIQIYCGGTRLNWDAHQDLEKNHRQLCGETDLPIAGLLTDLRARGLLDSTLVVWGAEFGRMPISQDGNGRDHNPQGFLTWMCGGGTKPGTSYGRTDELGHLAVEGKSTVPDFHATMLHLLGLDHTRLTYFHNGRNMRLTDVSGRVIREILA
ncbi:MAG: DUF1501 domain-containing protein [Gemmataceae bacterium]